MFRRLKSCHNVEDMRLLAKQRLPSPIFHYIDGAADDEVTYRRKAPLIRFRRSSTRWATRSM